MRTAAGLAVAAWTIAGAAASAQTLVKADLPASDAATVEVAAVRAEYATALSEGDAERALTLYAANAIVELGDGTVLRGSKDLARYFQSACGSAAGAVVAMKPTRFTVGDGVASETGTFTETRAGEPVTTGVYVAIYTRSDKGAWRISMELRTRGRDKQIVRW